MKGAFKNVRVGYLGNQIRGVSYSKGEAFAAPGLNLLPILRAGNITDSGLTYDDLQYIPQHKITEKQLLKHGDILIAASSGSKEVVGKASYVERDWNGSFGAFCKVFRPDVSKVYPKFIAHYFNSNKYRHTISNLAAGANINNLRNEHIDNLEILLPPLSEQKRIAAILDKAEEIKRKREESLKLADEFLKSVFVDMFGDPVTNPKGWEMKHLKEYITFLTSGSRGWAKYYSTSGEKFLRIQNVGRNRLLQNDMALVDPPDTQEAIRTKVRPNDLLISITADLGRTAVIPENFGIGYINQHLALVRLNGIVPLFISEFLKSEGGRLQFNSMNRSGVKSGLNFDNIKSLIIPVPPLEMQEEFAFLYKRYETNSERLIKASTIAEDLCSSLSQRAFSSRL